MLKIRLQQRIRRCDREKGKMDSRSDLACDVCMPAFSGQCKGSGTDVRPIFFHNDHNTCAGAP